MNGRVRRMLSSCYRIEINNRPVAIVDYDEFRLTGNITVAIIENPVDPHSNTSIHLAHGWNRPTFLRTAAGAGLNKSDRTGPVERQMFFDLRLINARKGQFYSGSDEILLDFDII